MRIRLLYFTYIYQPRRTAALLLVAILILSTFSPASAFADTSFSLNTISNDLTYIADQFSALISNLTDALASYIPATSLAASAATPVAAPSPDLHATAASTSSPATSTTSPAVPTTIVRQPIIQQFINQVTPSPQGDSVSPATLVTMLANLRSELLARIGTVPTQSGGGAAVPSYANTFGLSQRIDQLTNTAINTPTITGGSIIGANISGTIYGTGILSTGTLNLTSTATTSNSNLGSIVWNGTSFYGKTGTATTTSTGWFNLAQDNTIDVFLIGGQSNAEGRGDSSLSPVPELGTVFQYYNGSISSGSDPVGGAITGSAWPSFGITYYKATGRKVAFVPAAGSGYSINDWQSGGTVYPQSITRLNAAIAAFRAAGFTPIFKGVLWSQGETDAQFINASTETAATYQSLLTTMIANYRSTYGSSMPFYIFQTGTASGIPSF